MMPVYTYVLVEVQTVRIALKTYTNNTCVCDKYINATVSVQMRQHVKLYKLVYPGARVPEVQSTKEMRQLARGISFSNFFQEFLKEVGSETKFVQLLFGIHQLGANEGAPTTCKFVYCKLLCDEVSEARQLAES